MDMATQYQLNESNAKGCLLQVDASRIWTTSPYIEDAPRSSVPSWPWIIWEKDEIALDSKAAA